MPKKKLNRQLSTEYMNPPPLDLKGPSQKFTDINDDTILEATLIDSSIPVEKTTCKTLDDYAEVSKYSEIKVWPQALLHKILNNLKQPPDEKRANAFLEKYRWPSGLKNTVFRSVRKIAFRFFIVDDSGSMILNDGKRILNHKDQAKIVKCTRWAELSESMLFLAELSESCQVPSEFRLLNGADPIIVGMGDDNGESLKFLKEVMEESPAGPTPLCKQIEAVVAAIGSMAKTLRENGQKVAVIIATDGESSDGNVADALRPLTDLPVLVILRLCTEEQQVVDYWNQIDNQLELDIDVLDDVVGDARQVNEFNGWLTYGEPLHRLREFGASMKELDIIDESTLSVDQMRMICAYLFSGGNARDLPHPSADWKAFVGKIKELNKTVPVIFDPIKAQMTHWIDLPKLHKFYAAENSESAVCNIM